MYIGLERLAAPTALATFLFVSLSAKAQVKVTTIPCPGHGQPAAARTDADGTIHLVYRNGDRPRYTKSSDNGKTFSAAIPIVDRKSRKPGLEFDVWDMAIGKGQVHVALGTNAWKLKLPQEEW